MIGGTTYESEAHARKMVLLKIFESKKYNIQDHALTEHLIDKVMRREIGLYELFNPDPDQTI
jgi:hypothetical protein